MIDKRLPETDSIQELARFWDSHDLTDFEAELEEVEEPAFARESFVSVRLSPAEMASVRDIARVRGVALGEVIHEWVAEKVQK